MISSEEFGRDDRATKVYAHCAEKCFVKYSPDGKYQLTSKGTPVLSHFRRYLYSGGGEGKVYVYPLDKPLSMENAVGCRLHRGAVCSLAVQNSVVASCSTDGALAVYGAGPEGVPKGKFVYRSSLPMRTVCLSQDGKWIAGGSDGHEVVLVGLDDVEHSVKTAQHHKRPVTGVAFDPSGKFLASVDMDGLVVIQDMSLAKLDQFNVKTSAKYMPILAWSHDGQFLAVAGSEMLKIVHKDGDGWTVFKQLVLEEVHKETAGMFWAPSAAGSAVLVSHDMSTAAVWSVTGGTASPKYVVRHPGSIYSFDINPSNVLEVAFIDQEGMLNRQSSFFSPEDITELRTKPMKPTVKPAEVKKEKKSKSGISSMAKKYLASSAKDDDGYGSEDEDEEGPGIDLNDTSGGEEDDDEEDEEDGEDLGFDSLDDYSVQGDQEEEGEGEDRAESPMDIDKQNGNQVVGFTVHPPFQPGATDPKSEHRYLAWNLIGLITSRLDETGYRSVDIEFHDKVSTRPIRFIDDFGYKMASLSKSAAFFGSQGEAGSGNNGALHFMAFETWGGRQTWTAHLQEGEEVLAVAVDERWAYAATSNGWLRIFSPTGLQQPILTFAHDIVTMVAGAGKLLLVLNHHGHLVTQLYNVSPTVPCPVLIAEAPLGRRADKNWLTWAGISESGLVGCFDQTGVFYCLCDQLGFTWTPMADFGSTLEGDFVWPVFFDRSEITAIVCKNGESTPAVLPRPIMTNLAFKLPLLQPDDPTTASYEPVLRTTILSTLIDASKGLREKDLRRLNSASDKHVLELIQLAIKADKPVRALELCNLFYTEKSYDIAVQLARHHRLVSLADRIDQLKDEYMRKGSEGGLVGELATTPKLAVRLQQASPSLVLANLTPDERPSLKADETTLLSEASPSMARVKRPRMDLVADSTDIFPEEEETQYEPTETPAEHAAYTKPQYLPTMQSEPVEKKPKGLADMLARLSSMSTEPSKKAHVASLKENVAVPQTASIPAAQQTHQKSLKQASIASMFGKKTTPTEAPEASETPEVSETPEPADVSEPMEA